MMLDSGASGMLNADFAHLHNLVDELVHALGFNWYLTLLVAFVSLFFTLIVISRDPSSMRWGLICVFPLLLIGRLPWWRFGELNPDEGFVGAATLALYRDPVYWRSIIGGTHGPLVHYVTLIPALLGLKIDYASMRLVGALWLAGGSYVVLRSLSYSVHPVALSLGALPVLLFLAIAPFWDYQAYNGEQPLLFVLAVALALFYRLLMGGPRKRRSLVFVIAFVVGIVPLVKIQGGPTGGLIAAWAFCAYAKGQGLKVWLRDGAIVLVLGMCPVLIVVLLALYFGVLTELYQSGVAFNLLYVGRIQQPFISKAVEGMRLISEEPIARQLLWGYAKLLVVFAMVGFPFMKWTPDRKLVLLFSSFSFVLVSWFTVITPGTNFHHYVMLLSIPLMAWGIVVLDSFLSRRPPGRLGLSLAICPLLAVVFLLGFSVKSLVPRMRDVFAAHIEKDRDEFYRGAVAGVVSVSENADSLLVWGWSEWLNLKSGLPPATKYPSIAIITLTKSTPLEAYFRRQQELAIKNRQPAVIAEAIGPGLFLNAPKKEVGLKSIPSLNRFVRDNYVYWGRAGSIDLFVRKNRQRRLIKLIGHVDIAEALPRILIEYDYPERTKRALGEALRAGGGRMQLRSFFIELRQLRAARVLSVEDALYLKSSALLEARARISSRCLASLAECV